MRIKGGRGTISEPTGGLGNLISFFFKLLLRCKDLVLSSLPNSLFSAVSLFIWRQEDEQRIFLLEKHPLLPCLHTPVLGIPDSRKRFQIKQFQLLENLKVFLCGSAAVAWPLTHK